MRFLYTADSSLFFLNKTTKKIFKKIYHLKIPVL